MTISPSFSIHAQLSFASYATLDAGAPSSASLVDLAGMSQVQADLFAVEWTILDQYSAPNGASATVFKSNTDSKIYLAIRGTELTGPGAALLDLTADFLLGVGLPSFLNPQYVSLALKVGEWISTGTLTRGFSVTGHSLGGYLAGAIGANFKDYVSAVYLYNAPGIGGAVGGNAFEAVKQTLGLGNSALLPDTYNFRGSRGLSLIGAIGAQLSPPISVEIEGAPGTGVDNHTIPRISDSLAVFDALSRFGSDFDLTSFSAIVGASSIRQLDALESTLKPLQVALGLTPVALEDRDSLFTSIDELKQLSIDAPASFQIQSLAGLSASEIFSIANGPNGLYVRYALQSLDPYAVIGEDSLLVQDGFGEFELDLFDPETGEGLTQNYLADRSELLYWKNKYFIADGQGAFQGDRIETIKYSDKSFFDSAGNALTFTVRGRQTEAVPFPAFLTFGSDGDETLIGGTIALGDRLYGGQGDDELIGLDGGDYLQGDAGDDVLEGGGGDDLLVGGNGFDTYVYDPEDGFDTISDSDGQGRILYLGRELSGGSKVFGDSYRDESGVVYDLLDDGAGGTALLVNGDIYIEDYVDGALGISLGGDVDVDEAPESDAVHIYSEGEHPEDYDPQDEDRFAILRNLYGSSSDDLFLNAGQSEVIGRSGNDVALLAAGEAYSASMNMGAGDDYVDASASPGQDGTARIVGGSGNDFIVGSAGNDVIWGDNYRAYSAEALFGSSARFAGQYLIDDFGYNTDAEEMATFLGDLPPGYGKYLYLGEAVSLFGEAFRSVADDVLLPDGSAMAGSLQEAIELVLGIEGGFDDYVDAGDGDDQVHGGSGSDDLHGGDGDDLLGGDYDFSGSQGPEYARLQQHFGDVAFLFGRWGDDRIDGGDGDDVLSDVYGGNDILLGGEGNDHLSSREDYWTMAEDGPAHNSLRGGPGDDVIEADNHTGGFDLVDGGDGDDQITVASGRYSSDEDEDGNPEFIGTSAGRAMVFGGMGNDTLNVLADDAVVDGGPGDDEYTLSSGTIVLSDESGDDTAHLFLQDLSAVDASLELFPELDPEDEADLDAMDQVESAVVRREGSSLVYTSSLVVDGEFVSGVKIEFVDWFSGASHRIEHFTLETLEGPELSSAQFEAWGGVHRGAGADDILADASDYSDRAMGFGGDDLISTGAGDDRISGGKGDDELHGGSGNDTYYYALGDGNDVVYDSDGVDEIRFGPGVSPTDVLAEISGSGISIVLGEARIELREATRADPGIERLRFADGTTRALSVFLPPEPQPGPGPDPDPDPDPGPVESGGGGGSGGSGSEGPPTVPPVVEVAQSVPGRAAIQVVGRSSDGEAVSLPDMAFRAAGAGPESGSSSVSAGDALPPASELPAAPLELADLLDAMEAFTARQSPETLDAPKPPVAITTATAPEASQPLGSWALTNALLEFHLGRADPDGVVDGAADWFVPASPLAGLGTGPGALQSGLEAFGNSARSLPTFSGLQEGLARLY